MYEGGLSRTYILKSKLFDGILKCKDMFANVGMWHLVWSVGIFLHKFAEQKAYVMTNEFIADKQKD